VFHAWRALPSHTEEADEGADRDDNALGAMNPVRSRPLEDEGTQSLGGIGACIIAESIEKSHKDALIEIERRLSQPTVFAHPRTELSQHRPEVTRRWRGNRKRKLTLMLEEPDKHCGGR
jgi:hypothetical protein